MTDRFTTYDAAYLLGALSPEDRRGYEAHLRECHECSHAVAQLAGLPGLLAKATPPAPADPVPDSLLPRLLTEVTRHRARSRRIVVAALAAAAVLAAVLGTVVGLDGPDRPDDVRPGVAMAVVADGTPIRAEAMLDGKAWGTDIRLTCTYDEHAYGSGTYRLVVIGDDGATQQVATWSAVPGQVSTVAGSTSLEPAQIASVEVRDEQDRPVLTLTPDSDSLEE